MYLEVTKKMENFTFSAIGWWWWWNEDVKPWIYPHNELTALTMTNCIKYLHIFSGNNKRSADISIPIANSFPTLHVAFQWVTKWNSLKYKFIIRSPGELFPFILKQTRFMAYNRWRKFTRSPRIKSEKIVLGIDVYNLNKCKLSCTL